MNGISRPLRPLVWAVLLGLAAGGCNRLATGGPGVAEQTIELGRRLGAERWLEARRLLAPDFAYTDRKGQRVTDRPGDLAATAAFEASVTAVKRRTGLVFRVGGVRPLEAGG